MSDDVVLNESDSVFCASPSCVLHVRPGDANVRGRGNWADLGDGIIIGRQRVAESAGFQLVPVLRRRFLDQGKAQPQVRHQLPSE